MIDAHWVAAINGNWTDAARWSSNPTAPNNGTPGGTTYHAYLDAVGPSHTVILNSDVSLDNLTINSSTARLDHLAGTLSLSDSLNLVSGQFTLDGGTLAGTVNLLGGVFWVTGHSGNRLRGVTVNGTMNVIGGTRIANGLTLNGVLRMTNSGTGLPFLIMEGTQTITGGLIEFIHPSSFPQNMYLEGGASLTLSPTTVIRGGPARLGYPYLGGPPTSITNLGRISADISGRTIEVASGTFTNQGTIEAIGGGRLTVNNLVGNVGTARADGAGSLLTLAGTYANAATLDVTNGATLTLNGDWTNSGTINVVGGSTINLGGSFVQGDIGTLNRAGGSVQLTGTLDNFAGTLTLNNATGQWLLAGGTILGGSIVLQDGITLDTAGTATGHLVGTALNGTLNVNSGGRVSMEGAWANNGLITINGGTLDLGGTFSATGAIQRTGGTVNLTGTLNNTGGTLALNAATGSWNLAGGTILGGSITSSGGSQLVVIAGYPASTIDGAIVNAPISFSGSNFGLIANNVTLNNTVSIGSQSKLTLGGTWVNNGTIQLPASGGNLTLGGTFTRAGLGTVLGGGDGGGILLTGVMDNTGQTLAINSSTPAWGVAGGTIIGGAITVPIGLNKFGVGISASPAIPTTSTFSNVAFNGDMRIGGAQSTLLLRDGASIGGLVAFLEAGCTISYEGSPTIGATLSFQQSGVGSTASRVTVEGGQQLTVGPAGIIKGGQGVVGGKYVAGGFNSVVNQGLISADRANYLLSIVSDAFVNQGIVEAKSGGFLSILNATGDIGTARVLNSGSILTLAGDYSNSGALTVASGATLTLNGIWANSGTIGGPGAIINLGGTFTSSGSGTIAAAGGAINLVGTMNNAGNTLTLNATTGPWNLAGGTIVGGTVNLLDGIVLSGTTGVNPGRLSGTTINGNLNLQSGEIIVDSGTTLNGTASFVGGTLTSEGNQSLNAGTYAFNGTGTTRGSLRVRNGALPVTLTIGSATIIRGGNGDLGASPTLPDNDTIVNQGLISADISGRDLVIRSNVFTNQGTVEAINGGVLTIGQAGSTTAWSNSGLIRLNNGTLNLAGTFTVGALGNFQQVNSSLNILGTLNNTGATLNLSAATGPWNLKGGTLLGGTVNLSGGVRLGAIHGGGISRLDGATVNGDLDVSGSLDLVNGSVLNGGARLQGGILTYPAGTTIGPGVFQMEPRDLGGGSFTTALVRTDPTVTSNLIIGSGATIKGYGGRIGYRPLSNNTIDTVTNQGLISADVPHASFTLEVQSDIFSNQGTMEARSGGTLRIGMNFDAGMFEPPLVWTNTGIIDAVNGSVLLGGRVQTTNLGIVRQSPGAQAALVGDTINTGSTLGLGPDMNISYIGGQFRGGLITIPAGYNPYVAAKLDGVSFAGDFTSGGGTFLNGLNVAGMATVQGSLKASGSQTIGGGIFNLAGGGLGTMGGETLTLDSGVVVRGRGSVGARDASSGPSNTLLNNGLISADVPGQTLSIAAMSFTNNSGGVVEAVGGGTLAFGSSYWINTGIIRASSGGLVNLGGTFSSLGGSLVNNGGTIDITGTLNNQNSTLTVGGSVGDITLSRGTIFGGTIASTGGGRLVVPASGGGFATINGSTVGSNVDVLGRFLRLTGNPVINGLVSTSGAGATFLEFFDAATTLGGTGIIALNGESASQPHRLNVSSGGTVTFAPGITVRGGFASLVDPNGIGPGTLVNQGLIRADVFGRPLSIAANSFTNAGTVEAVNGGILSIAGTIGTDPSTPPTRTWSSTGLIRVNNATLNLGGTFATSSLAGLQRTGGTVQLEGTLDNTGAVFTLDGAANSWVMPGSFPQFGQLRGSRIKGGTVNLINGASLLIGAGQGGILDAVALNGNLSVDGNLFLANATSLGGTVAVNPGGGLWLGLPNLGANGPASTLSSGSIVLSGATGLPQIGSDHLYLGPGVSVRGSGTITRGFGTSGGSNLHVNQGLISSDVPGGIIHLNPVGRFTNTGTIEAINGSNLVIEAQFINDGLLRVNNSNLQLRGQLTTARFGTFERSGGTVTLSAYLDNTGDVFNLNSTTGAWIADGAWIKGGRLNIAPGGGLSFQGVTSTLDGVTVTGPFVLSAPNANIDIRSNLDLDGVATLSGDGARMRFLGANARFSGGTIAFDPSGGGADRRISSLVTTLTLEPDAIVRGGMGTILTSSNASIINQGRISADLSGYAISIYTVRFQNEGILEELNGGEIIFIDPESGPSMALINDGTLALGSGSSMIIPGSYTQGATGILNMLISGYLPGAGYAQLGIEEEVRLGGRLRLALGPGYIPGVGSRFDLLRFGQGMLTGEFASLDLPHLPGDWSWNTDSLYTNGSISVVPAPATAALFGTGILCMGRCRRPRESGVQS